MGLEKVEPTLPTSRRRKAINNYEKETYAYKKAPLLVLPQTDSAEYLHISPVLTGWEFLNLSARKMRQDEKWSFQTEENELVTPDNVCIEIRGRDNFYPKIQWYVSARI
jgi:hypothetical protein